MQRRRRHRRRRERQRSESAANFLLSLPRLLLRTIGTGRSRCGLGVDMDRVYKGWGMGWAEGGGVIWSPAAISLQLFALLFGLCHCLLFVCLPSFRQSAARCPLPADVAVAVNVCVGAPFEIVE